MNDNPYSGLLSIMREQGSVNNPPSLCLGEVVTTEPLTIKSEDLILDGEDLLVSDHLVEGYARECEITSSGQLASSTQSAAGGSGESSFASHSHEISGGYYQRGVGTVTYKSCLNKGDSVVLLPTANAQQYIVVSKVVKLV